MNRKDFIKSLFGGIVAAVTVKRLPAKPVVPTLAKETPVAASAVRWYPQYQLTQPRPVWAPYIIQPTEGKIFDPDTFTPSSEILERYAEKSINPDYFGKIKL